jgi:flavocytochrome c
VVVIDKSSFCGGNSTKATSGINAAGTRSQNALNIPDSPQQFYEDTLKGARELARPELIRVLTNESAESVHWLMDKFNLDMSVMGRLGGHSHPRTHRGGEQFPGMTITYALMEKIEDIAKAQPHKAKVLNKCRATRLLTNAAGDVIGVEYTDKKGETHQSMGPVIITSGGYGADFSASGLLAKHRPDLANADIATTNGEHCTGDGINMATAIGADTVDMKLVQVHPTGLVDPRDPDCKVKWLAAEALRGTGAVLLNGDGKRFCNELGHRDYVSGEMNKGKGPYRLILNSKCAKEIHWHCEHYTGRGLMSHMKSGADLAKFMGVSAATLDQTFKQYSQDCVAKKDAFGKLFFNNGPWDMNDNFFVATVTPVVHYTMGGLKIDGNSQVIGTNGQPIAGLWCAGECAGGVHGVNRLGGSSLLDCVVFGRVSGRNASAFVLESLLAQGPATGGGGGAASVTVTPTGDNKVNVEISWGKGVSSAASAATATAPASAAASAAPAEAEGAGVDRNKVWSWAEIAKHNTEDDCWVVVNGEVLDATSFLGDHPGGKGAIMLYAGKDATAEFNMLHKADVVEKYAPEIIIGKAEPKAKL